MESNLSQSGIYNEILNKIRQIDVSKFKDEADSSPITTIIEKQKVYLWIRLYLKEELTDIQTGDDFIMSYTRSGESMNTKFIAFGKKNLNRDTHNQMVNYDMEDDHKTLCLMVDENDIINSDKIPFLRTLFKTSSYYEYQLYRREELLFTNSRTNEVADYIDVDF